MSTIIGNNLPNIPWEEKPAGCKDILWRYSKNPIIDWNPIPTAGRVYNSAAKDGLHPSLRFTDSTSTDRVTSACLCDINHVPY